MQQDTPSLSVSVQAHKVQEVILSDVGTNKDRLGLTFVLEGDPLGMSVFRPMSACPNC